MHFGPLALVQPILAVAIFTNWSVYALMSACTAAMPLTSHAMAAGPLAAPL